MNTLFMRAFYTLIMAGAASYFVLMIFDWYYEKKHKAFEESQATADAQASTEKSAETAPQPQPVNQPPEQSGFKPLNPNDLPNGRS